MITVGWFIPARWNYTVQWLHAWERGDELAMEMISFAAKNTLECRPRNTPFPSSVPDTV